MKDSHSREKTKPYNLIQNMKTGIAVQTAIAFASRTYVRVGALKFFSASSVRSMIRCRVENNGESKSINLISISFSSSLAETTAPKVISLSVASILC
ncbi:hypothetical protein ACSQ67_018611 [Phaseolus vulgaris]